MINTNNRYVWNRFPSMESNIEARQTSNNRIDSNYSAESYNDNSNRYSLNSTNYLKARHNGTSQGKSNTTNTNIPIRNTNYSHSMCSFLFGLRNSASKQN